MNIIYQFIWIEKFYAQDFWKNKERISASLVRFYILIQKFYTIIEELFSINAYLMNQNMANFEVQINL